METPTLATSKHHIAIVLRLHVSTLRLAPEGIVDPPSGQVLSIELKAAFSAEVMLSAQKLLTSTQLFAYVQ